MLAPGHASSRWQLLVAVATALLGCSCGSPGSVEISLASSSISFTEYEGESYAGGSVEVTLLKASGTVYGRTVTSATDLVEPFFATSSGNNAEAGVRPLATLAPGNYWGTATVQVCQDAACSKVLTQKSFTFSFTILRGFSVAPAALTYDLDSSTPDVVVNQPLDIYLPAPGTLDYYWLDRSGQLLFLTDIDATHRGVAMTSYFIPPGTTRRIARFAYRRAGGYGYAVTKDVEFTVNVAPPPALIVTPMQLAFDAVQGGPAPAPRSLALAGEGGAALDYQTFMSAGAPSWLAVSHGAPATTPASVTVSVTRTDLAPGTYVGQAVFAPTTYQYASQVPVDVSYTVHPLSLTAAPGSVDFAVDPSTTPSQLTATVSLGDAGTPLAWTASATSTWLQLASASGLTGVNTLRLAVPPGALEALANGSYQDLVTIRYQEPSGGWFQVGIPVTLAVALPRVAWVAPRAEVSGLSSEVVLYGDRLDLLGPVTFDGVPATATTVVSPKELIVAHGPLSAGDVRVGSTGLLGLAQTMATLKVVDQRDRPAEAVAGTLSRPLLFDDAQEALYVFVGARLSRHAADGTWATAPDSWSYTDTLAFAPDGTLRGTGCRSGLWGTSLNAFDPDSLGGTSGPSLGGQCWEWDLAYGGDGVALLAPSSGSYPCMSYSQGAGALKPLPSTVQCGVGTGVVASTDGRRVVFGGAPGAGAVEYDPATGTFRQVMGAAPGKVVAIDRTGSRVVVADGTVYDRDWRTVARIDVLYAWPFALTPDGSKVVLWDQYSPLGKGAVRVFDVSSPEAPELGPEGGTVPAVDIGVALSIAVSADGRTAFLGGSAGYAVFPLP